VVVASEVNDLAHELMAEDVAATHGWDEAVEEGADPSRRSR
jgi:hypothetical protein